MIDVHNDEYYKNFYNNKKEDWLSAFVTLLDNTELRTYLGKNGKNTVNKNYTVKVLSNKYLNVLKSVSTN